MATLTITIDPAIDGRVLKAVAKHFGWPKGQAPPWESFATRKDFVVYALRNWMLTIARAREIEEAVEQADETAKAAATLAAEELNITVT